MHTGHIPGLVFLIIWARLWRTTLKEKVEERRKGIEQIVDLISTGYQIDFKLRLFFDHFVLCRKSDQNYKKTSRLVNVSLLKGSLSSVWGSPLHLIPREARLINLSGRAGPSGAKPREFKRKIYLYICVYVYIFEGVRTVAWQQWKTKYEWCQTVRRRLEQNLHTSEKICMQHQISTAMLINIHWIQNYLSRIFSLSLRKLFCERLHWRNYTFCGRGNIIFRGK